jgi:GH24 family phage-related lysozyme (muramidase)
MVAFGRLVTVTLVGKMTPQLKVEICACTKARLRARCDLLFYYWVDQSFAPAVDVDIGSPTPDVNQVQFEALASFTYNVGTAAFHSSTLLKKVQANYPNDPTI